MLALLASCASYTQRTSRAFADFQGGRFDAAAKGFADRDNTDSKFLSGAEAGTVELTAGNWERAREQFDRAAAAVRDVEERALVSASGTAESLGSWMLNDTVQAYEGEGYERVYLHGALALCYLGLGDAAGALVEAKRANKLLEREEALYEKQYQAGGFGHLLSALGYELSGQMDDARIDYERMVEKGVGTELAGKALVRITRAGARDELAQWIERFGDVQPPPRDAATIVLVAGVGLGPYKQESSLVWPTSDGVLTYAAPTHVERPQPVAYLQLDATDASGATTSARSVLVEHVASVARENLDDRIKWMAAKSVLRGVLKRELTQAIVKANDGSDSSAGIAFLAGTLFQIATERADLRCWSTLPDSWQAARLFVPPGVQRLRLSALGGEASDLGEVELRAGEWVFIVARTIDSRLYAHRIGGRAIAEPVAPSSGEAAARTLELLNAHSAGGTGSPETSNP
ncbi:MAG: hypothetical protein EPO68_10910 [Planctomycetota bacterium]|nr:MAG: hypothetical protein EPO68_10910 [Planctomycetota bacterium]